MAQVKKTMSGNDDDDDVRPGFQNGQKNLTGFICRSSHFITLRSIASAVICSDDKLVVSERFQLSHSVSLCVSPRYIGDRRITWDSTTASLGRNTALTPEVDLGLKTTTINLSIVHWRVGAIKQMRCLAKLAIGKR